MRRLRRLGLDRLDPAGDLVGRVGQPLGLGLGFGDPAAHVGVALGGVGGAHLPILLLLGRDASAL